MNGGGSQSPSYSTGNSSSGGWQQPFNGSPFNMNTPSMPSYQPQQQQSWGSMSPSYNAFSQMATSPLNNQQGVNTALQQQAALTAAQPTTAGLNFSLADANVVAGLPTTGQAQAQPSAPAPMPAPITPQTAPVLSAFDQWKSSQTGLTDKWGRDNSRQQYQYLIDTGQVNDSSFRY